jgi:single-stranded DNA-binding protein
MTAKITVDGWVKAVRELSWGTALTVSSDNRVKNAEGKWETASRDYYDVVLAEGVTLGNIREDDRVVVSGTFKTGKTFQKKDGTTGVELKVRATSVAPHESQPAPATVGAGQYDLDVPF